MVTADVECVRAALHFVPATDRDTWFRMGAAVKDALGEDGFDLWDEWSQQDASYKERDAKAVWRSITEGGGIGIGTLLHAAKERGFDMRSVERQALPIAESERLQRERDARINKVAEQRAREEQRAADKAKMIWDSAKPASAEHPYLQEKGIPPAGMRVHGSTLVIDGMRCAGAIVVPFRNAGGDLRTVEFISTEGKRFLPGGSFKGCYYALGQPGTRICITEGVATAASVHEATGLPVRAAGSAGNLLAVALAVRSKAPDAELTICADNDSATAGNPGVTAATAAAQAVGGLLTVCPTINGKAADFNDLMRSQGHDAVKAAIEGASKPVATTSPAQAAKHLGMQPQPVIYARLSDIQPKPIRWLWPRRIARGKVSMIAGHPGLGKSQITASLAAIVTKAGRWPVDRTACELGSVVFLSAEDDPADTIRPRLEAAGADISKVHIVQAIRDGYTPEGDERQRAFNLREDIRRLEGVLTEIGDVALVVIDPVSAYLGNTESHNNAEVRALLAPLSDMASRAGAAVLAVSHLNKGGAGGDALLRVTGSLAFVAAARAAFIVAKDPENDRRRLFLPAKNNVGPDIGGLAFEIEGCSIGAGIETSRIAWETEAVNGVSADELLRAPSDPEERNALDDAKAWTESMLADGAVPSKQFMTEGKEAGHAERTLMRARRDLKVEASKEGKSGPWMLRLALKAAKKPEECQPQMVGSLGNLGSLQGSGGGEDEVIA